LVHVILTDFGNHVQKFTWPAKRMLYVKARHFPVCRQFRAHSSQCADSSQGAHSSPCADSSQGAHSSRCSDSSQCADSSLCAGSSISANLRELPIRFYEAESFGCLQDISNQFRNPEVKEHFGECPARIGTVSHLTPL